MTEKKVIETTNGWYMENEKTKVELEDIVGLVQTDDSTNSVQLKKEAQLSICEQRVIELEKENEQLKHQLSQQEMEYATDCYRLAEENMQLQEELDYYKTKCGSLETALVQGRRAVDKEKEQRMFFVDMEKQRKMFR